MELRLAILRTNFIGPHSAAYVIFNPLETPFLREEAVYDVSGDLWSPPGSDIFDRLTDLRRHPEPYLRNAAIGSLILATWPLISPDEEGFGIFGLSEYENAGLAYFRLKGLDLAGDKIKRVGAPIKKFIARHLPAKMDVEKFLEWAAQVEKHLAVR